MLHFRHTPSLRQLLAQPLIFPVNLLQRGDIPARIVRVKDLQQVLIPFL